MRWFQTSGPRPPRRSEGCPDIGRFGLYFRDKERRTRGKRAGLKSLHSALMQRLKYLSSIKEDFVLSASVE